MAEADQLALVPDPTAVTRPGSCPTAIIAGQATPPRVLAPAGWSLFSQVLCPEH